MTLPCLAALAGALIALLPPDAKAEPALREIAMAAPDIVALTLEGPPFERGRLIRLDAPRSEPVGTWVRHGEGWGLVVGPERDHLRLADTPPSSFLDRALADDAANYGLVGQRRVTAVYRKSMPYDSGLYRGPGGEERSGASFRHQLYLKLDGPLREGEYALAAPGVLPADTRFAFDDGRTRAVAIHATQLGHRANDLAKVGFLSLWLPGGPDQGAVDFRRYALKTFRVVDDAGASVFEAPIRLRAGPADPEPGNGLAHDLVDTLDADADPVPIRALEGVRIVTTEPHGLKAGTRVGLQRLNGDQDAAATFGTVTEADRTSFALTELDGPALPGHAQPGASVTPAHQTNRAGTFVFELDYSAWKPKAPGAYRLQVPGLGVSDPFTIADDIWLRSAALSLGALYDHRSGIALDDRAGFTRPAAFRPGNGFRVWRSRLPLAWSSEFAGGFVPFAEGAKEPWITRSLAPADAWGGYMDAGDWDRRIQHVEVSSLLLEVEEAIARSGVSTRSLPIPLSSAVLSDPIYRGTDALPPLVHEAIWLLDFYRRLQGADGSIPGGIESAGHPQKGEPSFLEHRTVFAYAPDHLSSYLYAATAAKLARTLREAGSAELADMFEASALAAWLFAEAAYADPDTALASSIQAGEAAGAFDAASWSERRRAMQAQAGELRVAAAAALYRLDGSRARARIFEEAWDGGWDLYAHKGDAAWDYLQAKGGDARIKNEIGKMIVAEADSLVAAQDRLSYPAMKHPFAPAGWGQGGSPDYGATMLLMRAHTLNGDPRILKTMERAHHAMLGANQLGLSLMTGVGVRSVGGVLHEDSLAMGVGVPPGITVYGWAPQSASAFGWIFGPPWSALPETGRDEDAEHRRIEPARFALPYYEYLVEHPSLVMQMEYTVQQTIAPMATLALYLVAN